MPNDTNNVNHSCDVDTVNHNSVNDDNAILPMTHHSQTQCRNHMTVNVCGDPQPVGIMQTLIDDTIWIHINTLPGAPYTPLHPEASVSSV